MPSLGTSEQLYRDMRIASIAQCAGQQERLCTGQTSGSASRDGPQRLELCLAIRPRPQLSKSNAARVGIGNSGGRDRRSQPSSGLGWAIRLLAPVVQRRRERQPHRRRSSLDFFSCLYGLDNARSIPPRGKHRHRLPQSRAVMSSGFAERISTSFSGASDRPSCLRRLFHLLEQSSHAIPSRRVPSISHQANDSLRHVAGGKPAGQIIAGLLGIIAPQLGLLKRQVHLYRTAWCSCQVGPAGAHNASR